MASRPLELVNLRMRLYNERQVDAILAPYADDIEVYAYPDRLLGKGKPVTSFPSMKRETA
jgi:hypothetical protein